MNALRAIAGFIISWSLAIVAGLAVWGLLCMIHLQPPDEMDVWMAEVERDRAEQAAAEAESKADDAAWDAWRKEQIRLKEEAEDAEYDDYDPEPPFGESVCGIKILNQLPKREWGPGQVEGRLPGATK